MHLILCSVADGRLGWEGWAGVPTTDFLLCLPVHLFTNFTGVCITQNRQQLVDNAVSDTQEVVCSRKKRV